MCLKLTLWRREHSFEADAPVTPSNKAKGMPVQHRTSLFSSPFGCLKPRAALGGCCNGQASPAILKMYKVMAPNSQPNHNPRKRQ